MTRPSKTYVLAVTAAGLLAIPSLAAAQAANFAGTWTFDSSKSTGTPELPSVSDRVNTGYGRQFGPGGDRQAIVVQAERGALRAGGRAVPEAGGVTAAPVDINQLVVKQSAIDLDLQTAGFALRYKLDGTEDTISALQLPNWPKGKATWDGNKLVLTTTRQVYIGRNEFAPRNTKEVFSLDGNVLTIETTENPPQGSPVTKKLVFNRASS